MIYARSSSKCLHCSVRSNNMAEIIQFLIGQIQTKPLTLKSLREFVPSFVGMVFGNSSNKIEKKNVCGRQWFVKAMFVSDCNL